MMGELSYHIVVELTVCEMSTEHKFCFLCSASPKMSSYLVAFVVCDFGSTDPYNITSISGKNITVSLLQQIDYSFIIFYICHIYSDGLVLCMSLDTLNQTVLQLTIFGFGFPTQPKSQKCGLQNSLTLNSDKQLIFLS